jgi:hypothetical protein
MAAMHYTPVILKQCIDLSVPERQVLSHMNMNMIWIAEQKKLQPRTVSTPHKFTYNHVPNISNLFACSWAGNQYMINERPQQTLLG